MDDDLPVKDVGLAVDTGLAYSEDDYKGHRAASLYVGFQVPGSRKSEGHHSASSTSPPGSPHHRQGHSHHRRSHGHRHHKPRHANDGSSAPAVGGPGEGGGGGAGGGGGGVLAGEEAPPSQRVQFILGGEEDEEHHPHQLFSEMDELRTDTHGQVEWKETARWVKFEEDVEEGGERWSKPHVATLSLHSLFELRNCLMNHSVLLDVEVASMDDVVQQIVNQPVYSYLTEEQKTKIQQHLVNLRHKHQHDKKAPQSGKQSAFHPIRSLSEIGKKASGVSSNGDWANDTNFLHPKDYLRQQMERSLAYRRRRESESSNTGSAFSTQDDHLAPPTIEITAPQNPQVIQQESSAKDLQERSASQTDVSCVEVDPATPPGETQRSQTPPEVGTNSSLTPPLIAVDPTISSSSSNMLKNNSQSKFNQAFMKKIPAGAEAHNVLVGEVDFLEGDDKIVSFVRLAKATHFGDLTEVPIPTRFLFILLGAKQKASSGAQSGRYHEIGRSIATLMSDELFHEVAYKAKDRQDLLSGIDEFLDQVTVLPPGEWDPAIRIEPPTSVPSQNDRKGSSKTGPTGPIDNPDEESGQKHDQGPHKEDVSETDEWEAMGLVRTGRLFGGLRNDIKRKAPFYWSDYKDGLSVQCIASFFFLYFACLTPIVTFGGLLSDATGKGLGAIESLLSGVISGVTYHLFSGQPLTIIGSTGPVLVFETICYNFCQTWGLDYVSFRFWIGLWTALILFLMVAFDLSYLVCYITRFTEESFATLIAIIFIKEAFSKLSHIIDANPVQTDVLRTVLPFAREDLNCSCIPRELNVSAKAEDVAQMPNGSTLLTFDTWGPTHINWTRFQSKSYYDCLHDDKYEGKLWPEACATSDEAFVPDVYFMSIILFFGTFALAYSLKTFRNTGFFPTRVRTILSDFAVLIAIVVFVLIDYSVSLPTPKLDVPTKFQPTDAENRGWVVNPLKNALWTIPAAVIPACLATILIFMDQQITAVIVNRRENLLKKGCGYHLDLLIIAALVAVNAVLGLPWFVAATVLSMCHVQSLRMESETSAPGEKPVFLGVRETRLTGVLIFLFIGLSVLMTSVLRLIPMPVLFGVFLYMGVSSLKGIQLMDRIMLIFMPTKYQPDYMYLRHVRTWRVHLFTFMQVVCLAILWTLKSFKESSILFPLMVLALVGVRKALEFVFTKHELSELDDIMPEFHKKEEAEKLVSDEGDPVGVQDCIPEKKRYDETDQIDISEGNVLMDANKNQPSDINITDEICKTSNWKCINSHNSSHSPDKTSSMKHRKHKSHNGHHHHHHHHHHHGHHHRDKKEGRRPSDESPPRDVDGLPE